MKRTGIPVWGGLLCVALFLLSACTAAPGMKAQGAGRAKIANGPVIEIETITMDLLNRLSQQKQEQAEQAMEVFTEQRREYRVGAGDILQITVWDHPELTIPAGSFRDPDDSGQQIGENGTLFYPYVGTFTAAGLTVPELRGFLTDKLSTYITDPQLDVRVVAYRSQRVYVVGEVNNPGILPIDDVPLTVVDAVSRAGGLSEEAYRSGVNVARDGEVFPIDLRAMYEYADVGRNIVLKHGDIVNVLDRSQQKVFMLGEVNRPSSVEIRLGRLSLAAALGEVGGVNQETADAGRIFVIRGRDTDRPRIFRLNAKQAFGLVLAEQFALQAQDVVFVDAASVSNWDRTISPLLPSNIAINVTGIN